MGGFFTEYSQGIFSLKYRMFLHSCLKIETVDVWELQTSTQHVTHLVGKARVLERVFHTLNRKSGCVDSFKPWKLLSERSYWKLPTLNVCIFHTSNDFLVPMIQRSKRQEFVLLWEHSDSVLLRTRLGPQKLSSSGSGYYVVCCIFTGASD